MLMVAVQIHIPHLPDSSRIHTRNMRARATLRTEFYALPALPASLYSPLGLRLFRWRISAG